MMDIVDMRDQLEELLDGAMHEFSTLKPSQWNEKHRTLTSDLTPYPGPMNYDRTPYLREPVNNFAPDHPMKVQAVMKGAQIGFSVGLIEAAIGYIISENPGNILFLSGHQELSEEAMNTKIDAMIDTCGLRPLIRPNILRKKNSRTGDTSRSKEFPGGSLVAGSANNHKLLRQRSIRFAFIDDFDAVKTKSKESGSSRTLIEQRLAAYYSKMKLAYISTPEIKNYSNIETAFALGDQRKYYVPCPCCGEFIVLEWSVEIDGDENEKGGITWKTTDTGRLIPNSVGYICQNCGGFFTDKHKYEMNLVGEWRPTAESQRENYYSYHISSLYAPPGMKDWAAYAQEYIEANPENQPQNSALMHALTNLCFGLPYEDTTESPQANQLMKNLRPYAVNTVPGKLSLNDGNGEIVLLTCACDLNGIVEDARLDYEIVGWTEKGASYSITHGSIGTFIPREGGKGPDRKRWTYEQYQPNSVWPELDKVLNQIYETGTGRRTRIMLAGIDTGHYTQYAYNYIDSTNFPVVGLKGADTEEYTKITADVSIFKSAQERDKLYLVKVNRIKDMVAARMKLKWNKNNDEGQPSGFMNFPTPSGMLYTYPSYFSHFEAEHSVVDTGTSGAVRMRWVKKNSTVQNHLFDCRVYNIALKRIITSILCKEAKIKEPNWADFVRLITGKQ